MMKGNNMTKLFITKAHYPSGFTSQELEEMELHESSYGLCHHCTTLSKHVVYPCSIVQDIVSGKNLG
jgi:hypothetical protein